MDNDLQIFEGSTIPNIIADRYKELPSVMQEKSEDELRKENNFSYIDEKLRMNLWKAISENFSTGKTISMTGIHEGVCSRNNFYKVLKSDHRLAFLMSPVQSYDEKAETLLEVASSRYMEILNMDIMTTKRTPVGIDDEGKIKYGIKTDVDPFKAKLLLDTISNIENRVKGTSVQKSITIHDKTPEDGVVDSLDVSAIQARINELETKMGSSNIDDNSIVTVDFKEKE